MIFHFWWIVLVYVPQESFSLKFRGGSLRNTDYSSSSSSSFFIALTARKFRTSYPRHSVISNPINFVIHLFKHSFMTSDLIITLVCICFLFSVSYLYLSNTSLCVFIICCFINFLGSRWGHKLFLFLSTYCIILLIVFWGKFILSFSSKTVT